MSSFLGYHSEWNLGSPGGWDYQRMTQEIAKVVWQKINTVRPTGVNLDFNNDVFLKLHRKHDLTPLYQAIRENRILNPRGTEPINVKSMFEVITGPQSARFDPETVRRTPWTRRFYSRRTTGYHHPGDSEFGSGK